MWNFLGKFFVKWPDKTYCTKNFASPRWVFHDPSQKYKPFWMFPEVVRAPRMRLYRAELVEACNDLLKCVISRISSHHDPEVPDSVPHPLPPFIHPLHPPAATFWYPVLPGVLPTLSTRSLQSVSIAAHRHRRKLCRDAVSINARSANRDRSHGQASDLISGANIGFRCLSWV